MTIKEDIIDDYYLGLILLNPYIYNKDTARRMLDDVNYDPFADMNLITGMIQGEVTLLRKCNDSEYCDEYSSRYKNEVKLRLGQTNEYGIKLVHLKPFSKVFKEEPPVLIKEDLEKDFSPLEDILFNNEYYLRYSKLDKTTVPVIVREDKLEIVRDEYYEKTYRNKNNQYIKK